MRPGRLLCLADERNERLRRQEESPMVARMSESVTGRMGWVVVGALLLPACGGSGAAVPATAASSAGGAVEIAWELRPVSSDPDRPKTAVALAIRGAAVGRIDAGELFGKCSPLDKAAWARPEKPLAAIVCGYAGNFRNVGVFRVGDTLTIRVHEIEEGNHPDAKETSTAGTPVAIPAGAAVTVAAPAK
jgi:hypothetical protein